MSRELPEKSNLEYLKKQAKELLRSMPQGKLADAQHKRSRVRIRLSGSNVVTDTRRRNSLRRSALSTFKTIGNSVSNRRSALLASSLLRLLCFGSLLLCTKSFQFCALQLFSLCFNSIRDIPKLCPRRKRLARRTRVARFIRSDAAVPATATLFAPPPAVTYKMAFFPLFV
jgi:hypothetical protein